jgi:hypothetical protein
MHVLTRLWREHRLLTLAFAVAAALTVAFAVRFALHVGPFRQPPRDPPIQAWMSPRLVAMGWHLPPEVLDPALGIPLRSGRGRTLEDIAAEQGIPFEALKARIEAAIVTWRAVHPEDAE